MINTIITGDARQLSKAIPDNSIDLIFTDPPYLKEYMHLYEWLAEESARVLKPGGFLLAYTGNYWHFDTVKLMASHIPHWFDFIVRMPGDNSIIWNKYIIAQHKFIAVFCKGDGMPKTMVLSSWASKASDKRFHVWGQDESTARYYIDCFSSPGELIWEPFTGGGTTPYVCKQLHRNFIGFEIDPTTADIARARLETVQPLLFDAAAEQLALEVTA